MILPVYGNRLKVPPMMPPRDAIGVMAQHIGHRANSGGGEFRGQNSGETILDFAPLLSLRWSAIFALSYTGHQ
jgi:hypothetical protein